MLQISEPSSAFSDEAIAAMDDLSLVEGATEAVPQASPASALGDLTLVRAAQSGDEAAFAAIVQRYDHRIRGMCRRYVRDHDLVDDLVQQTFCRLFVNLERIAEEAQLSPWIHRTATNLCLDELRRQARRPRAELRSEEDGCFLDDVADTDRSGRPDSANADTATRELIWEAMRRLPQRQREVLILRDVWGMDHPEVSRRLHMAPGAVQGVLHRARERFKLEYVRLESAPTGDDECVKVAFVMENISRSSLRQDRLHAVERHLANCESCGASLRPLWVQIEPVWTSDGITIDGTSPTRAHALLQQAN